MSEEFNVMIAGVKSASDKLQVVAPWDLTPIADVPVASAKDVDHALSVAHEIFADRDRWLPIPKRIEVLEKNSRDYARAGRASCH